MIDLLILLLRPALRYVEGGEKRFILIALFAWIVDVTIAHTTFRAVAGKPLKTEWTVSDVVQRIANDNTHEDQLFFIELAKFLNKQSPTGKHIKLWTQHVLTT